VNTSVAKGLTAAAVLGTFLVGCNLLSSPTAESDEPSQSAAPSEAEPSSAAAGLPVGSSFELADEPVLIQATIPAPGWWNDDAGTLVRTGDGSAPGHGETLEPDGAYLLGLWAGEPLIPSDPCRWSSTMPDTPATTLEEIVTALASQETRDASAPMDVTVDGHPGKSITLHVPGDIAYSADEFTDCDEGKFCTLGFPGEAGCHMWYQGPDEFQEIWIVSVDGEFLYETGNYWPGTSPDVVEELGAILASMTFTE
jgi:hypothetical protein